MGRHAVFFRLKQETEARLCAFLGKTQRLKHLVLNLGVAYSDGATAKLAAVEHHIVGAGVAVAGVGHQLVLITLARAGEGVVHCHPTVLLIRPLEQREVGDPKEVEFALGNEVEAAGNLQTEGAECAEHNIVAVIRHYEDNVAGFGAEAFADCDFFFLGKEFFVA